MSFISRHSSDVTTTVPYLDGPLTALSCGLLVCREEEVNGRGGGETKGVVLEAR